MNATIEVTSLKASSTVETKGAVDATVTVDGVTGEVTLCPREDGHPSHAAWGMGPDHWLSYNLCDLDEETMGEVERAVSSAAAGVGSWTYESGRYSYELAQ